MQIIRQTSTALARLLGFVLGLISLAVMFVMALVLAVIGLLARGLPRRTPLKEGTVDFVRNSDGTWVHPA